MCNTIFIIAILYILFYIFVLSSQSFTSIEFKFNGDSDMQFIGELTQQNCNNLI